MCQNHHSRDRRTFLSNLLSFSVGIATGAFAASAPVKKTAKDSTQKETKNAEPISVSPDWVTKIRWDDDRLAEDLKTGWIIGGKTYLVNRNFAVPDGMILYNCNFIYGPGFKEILLTPKTTARICACYFSSMMTRMDNPDPKTA